MGLEPASVGSWLAHTPWLVPLGTVTTAIAATVAAGIAAFIGKQARKVALGANSVAASQREIAGLSELNTLSEKLRTRRYLEVRKKVATRYPSGDVEEASALELLDFMEEVAVYEERGFVSITTIWSLFSQAFICWWYVTSPLLEQYRLRMHDPRMYLGTATLITKLHELSKLDAPAWARRPPDEVMSAFFAEEIERVTAATSWLEADAKGDD